MIANSHKPRGSWHLAPCFGVLALALLLAHPGRVKSFRPEFDRNRFPVDAATFLSHKEAWSA